jgi:alkanesulfonate monooxygenase SsuD/methylene tetrahydromethanopterin reductase-like flavin-dependent oxidoreductase (luciferase family)
VHIGVLLPTREALRADTPGVITWFADAAEHADVDSLWTGDSLLARPLFDPFVVLATVAARTQRVRIGTAALLAPLRPAVPTAQALASIDKLSDGRLIVGAGRGFDLPETRREFEAAGADFDRRSSRMNSTIRTWRACWAPGGDLLPEPAQLGGPPVWIAGYGPAAFRRTGRLGDGWLPYPPTAQAYADGLAHVRAEAVKAGRDPDDITPAVMMTIAIGNESAQAQQELAMYVPEFYNYPLEIVSLLQAMRSGTADEIVDSIREYWDAGARVFLIRLASLADPLGALDVFTRNVVPRMREWAPVTVGA